MKKCLIALIFLATTDVASGQTTRKCGDDIFRKAIDARYPEKPNTTDRQAYFKITADDDVTIPVVFHVVLTQAQLNFMGGEIAVAQMIDSQLAVINHDFTSQNRDTAKIPAAFKPLMGNPRIRFALARTTPAGIATSGYEIKSTTRQGFKIVGNAFGTGFGFSDAKYAASGGLDAWDPSTYLNIWVINAQDDNAQADILGMCIPPSFTNFREFPAEETGVVLSYKAWNKLTDFRGRTLTHELGHFFELRHLWGDDDGKCPQSLGEDDGINDTPPQSLETYGCPAFPKLDACSRNFPGIMFMNFMDYTDDNCQHLFTAGQVTRMRDQIGPGAPSYSLTQHPEVLKLPSGAMNNYSIYPNPGNGQVNVRFDHTSSGVAYLRITNMLGQAIAEETVNTQKGFYSFNLRHTGSGIYFLQMEWNGKLMVEKIIVR
jgi:hypothetical protein